MRQLVTAALVLALVTVAGVAQAQGKPDPTGTWTWTVQFGGQSREATLKLKLEGDKLMGAMVGRNGQETPIQDAKYTDSEVSFKVVRERNGQTMTSTYTGKVSGDTIKGKIEGQTRSRDWEAKRAAAANPTGTWQWSVTFGGQTREVTLKLKLEADKLTGAMVGRDGQETAIQDAKHKDGEVSFTVVRERNGQKMTAKYAGKVSGDTIKGKMEFERDGQTQSRDWEAKRAAAANPTGTWKWSVTFGDQTREMTLKLKLEGDKLTGAMVGPGGQETAIEDAKCKDGEVSFKVVRERNGQKMIFNYAGKVSADSVKGKMEFEREGQTQSRDWEAKRAND